VVEIGFTVLDGKVANLLVDALARHVLTIPKMKQLYPIAPVLVNICLYEKTP
jgi:hypothetical protein